MLTIPETVEDELVVAKCYAELGNVTKEKGELDESLRYHRKSMEIFERMDDALSVADSHLNIAEIYKAKGELKQAMNEYEIGLTLYEDLYVEDVSKSSDSGTDVSLTSSSFSDLQHTRALSKSDETLLQTTLTDIIENDVPLSSPRFASNGITSTSNVTSDMNLPSIEILSPLEDTLQATTYTDYPSLISSENMADELLKSLTSSDFMYDTTVETTPEQSDIFEICSPFDPMNQELLLQTANSLLFDSKLEENNDENELTSARKYPTSKERKHINNIYQYWHGISTKQRLIIILSLILAGILFWSIYDTSIKSILSCSSEDSTRQRNTPTHNTDDLSEQLRKILAWRKDRMTSLSRDNKQIIEGLLTDTDSRTEITVDRFQRILDILDLKMVLIPR